MPPKVKVTKEEIILKSLDLVRKNGEQGINARAIASALGCSTQPIFSNFSTMEELTAATVAYAHRHYLDFLKKESESGKYPPYKSFGMAYIRFAKEESELFKLLFMCDRKGAEFVPTVDFTESVKMIVNANGVSSETAELMHLEMWSCVHGIGTMLATSFLSFEWELIEKMLTDVYQGIRSKYVSEVNGNGSN